MAVWAEIPAKTCKFGRNLRGSAIFTGCIVFMCKHNSRRGLPVKGILMAKLALFDFLMLNT